MRSVEVRFVGSYVHVRLENPDLVRMILDRYSEEGQHPWLQAIEASISSFDAALWLSS
jgi:hypothetical protein